MKTIIFLINLILLVSLASCKKNTESQTEKHFDTSKKINVEPELHRELYGIYSGEFSGMAKEIDEYDHQEYETKVYKKLSIKINRITKDSVYGQSIVEGNQRPFRGIFNPETKKFVLQEPGNDPTDGKFEVTIKGDSLTGNWIAYQKTKVKAPEKSVKLIKKNFVYNPNHMLDENSDLVDWSNSKEFVEKYIDPETHKTEQYTVQKNRIASEAIFKINASQQKLNENQLKNLRKLDLQIIKNSVFARHGYAFKKETFRNFFEQTDWYIPISNNVDQDLTPLEKENIAMLNRFITYAEDHYDSFGR